MARGGIFLVLFFIGGSAVALAAMAGDLVIYYKNHLELAGVEQRLEVLRSLNADYQSLLYRVENDPNVVKRLAPATLGKELQDPETAYPEARAEALAAARSALEGRTDDQVSTTQVPQWLVRCSEPGRRFALFLAGSGLVIVASIFFGLGRSSQDEVAPDVGPAQDPRRSPRFWSR